MRLPRSLAAALYQTQNTQSKRSIGNMEKPSFTPKKVLILSKLTRYEFEKRVNKGCSDEQLATLVSLETRSFLFKKTNFSSKNVDQTMEDCCRSIRFIIPISILFNGNQSKLFEIPAEISSNLNPKTFPETPESNPVWSVASGTPRKPSIGQMPCSQLAETEPS